MCRQAISPSAPWSSRDRWTGFAGKPVALVGMAVPLMDRMVTRVFGGAASPGRAAPASERVGAVRGSVAFVALLHCDSNAIGKDRELGILRRSGVPRLEDLE